MVDFAKKLAEKRLKEKLEAAVRKPSAPSMVPSWTSRKKKEEEPPPPDIRELEVPDAERKIITRMVMEHVTHGLMEKEAKKKKEDVTKSLKPYCNKYGLDKFMVDGNRVTYYTTTKSTISKELLLAAGVAPEIITKCTISKPSQALKITVPGITETETED